MRGIIVGPRSVYRNCRCMHCHKPVKDRAALGTTLYISEIFVARTNTKWWRVKTQSRTRYLSKQNRSPYASRPWGGEVKAEDHDETEIEIRIAYHRTCIDKILEKAPVDEHIALSRFEQFREQVVENLREM